MKRKHSNDDVSKQRFSPRRASHLFFCCTLYWAVVPPRPIPLLFMPPAVTLSPVSLAFPAQQ